MRSLCFSAVLDPFFSLNDVYLSLGLFPCISRAPFRSSLRKVCRLMLFMISMSEVTFLPSYLIDTWTDTDIPCLYCALLYHASQILHFFTNWRLWQPCIKSTSTTSFGQHLLTFIFLCHILVIFAVFQTFSLFYLLWSVISDLWCYYCKKITTCWRLRWWLTTFSSEVFFY